MLRNRTASFDYKGLDGSAREVLQSHARTLSELSRRTAKNLWKMGKILADVRERLASHNGGSFKHWVENEAGLSRSTAYRLINVYRTFSCPTVGQLGISPKVLYLLSEPSTPAAAREEALRYARDGERITHARAQEIVQQHRPSRPPLPPLPPLPEYREFEREELLPNLRDGGDSHDPQALSGVQEELEPVPKERKEQARASLRSAIIAAVQDAGAGDEGALSDCADEILEILGQRPSSIAVAARIGAALSNGPRTLSDLVAIAAWVLGDRVEDLERSDYLALHKRTKHLVDSISYQGGLPVFEHTLLDGQIAYGLIEDPPDCP